VTGLSALDLLILALASWRLASLLVQEAGGSVCRFDGTPVSFFENCDMVAAAPDSAPGLLALTTKLPTTAALLAKQG